MTTDYIDPTLPEDVQSIIRKNMPYPANNVVKGANIMGARDDPNTLAWVDPQMRTTMFINNNRKGMLFPKSTPAHELEHMLQFSTDKRYPQGYDTEVVNQYVQQNPKKNSTGRMVEHLRRISKNSDLREYLAGLTGEWVAPYIGGAKDVKQDFYSLKEQFAELSAIEQTIKKDLTKDPYVRKHYFGDDEDFIETYRATTGLRQTRLDAKDMAPMTVPPKAAAPAPTKERSVLEKILGGFK